MSRSKLPPQWMMRFFRWFCRHDLADAVEGDLLELFERNRSEKGSVIASTRYFWQVLTFCRPFAIKKRKKRSRLNPVDMLKLQIKLTFRNLFRTGFYSFTNIFSLATGITAVILLMSFVSGELSYDRFHKFGDRTYRFGYQLETDNQPTRQLAWVSALVGPAATERFPEIESMVRVRDCMGTMVNSQNEVFLEDKGFFAGDRFFDVFSFPVIAGDALTALDAPNKIVLTESMATRYFGDENPVGRQMELRMSDTLRLQVSAVMKDVPDNAHFRFDYLISHKTREVLYPHIQGWFALGTHTYFRLTEEASVADFNAKVEGMVMDIYGEEAQQIGFTIRLFTQPLWDIHLKSKLGNEIAANGDIQYVFIAAGIALVILLIASFNFINLSIAKSYRFVRQMGIRKVLGAQRSQIFSHFITESVISVLLAFGLALVLSVLLMPYFNELVGRDLSVVWKGWMSVTALGGLLLIVGLVAGTYPAVSVVAVRATEAVKGKLAAVQKRSFTREGLIVTQFGLATVLIIAVLVIRGQLGYMMNSSLGFDHEQTAVIELWNNRAARANSSVLKNELLKSPNISHVAASNSIPGELLLNRVGYPDGNESLSKVMFSLMVQEDFLELYELNIAAGRAFSPDLSTDQTDAFLLNESAVIEFGWSNEEAIGRDFQWGSRTGKVIGVVEDFHYYSLQEKVPPMIILPTEGGVGYMSVKVTGEAHETVAQMERTWKSLYPDQVFKLFFLDDNFNEQYKLESQLDRIMSLFTLVAVLIACFGLFSLSAIHVEQRTKEIGIRKVLGASVPGVLFLIGRFFLRLVALSFLFALPASWLLGDWWLSDFAYRMELSPVIFAIAIGVSLSVAALTIIAQALRAALANPVKTLRYE